MKHDKDSLDHVPEFGVYGAKVCAVRDCGRMLKDDKKECTIEGCPYVAAEAIRQKTVDAKKERVHHPQHYGGPDNPYEVIRVLESWLTPEQFEGFLIGNVIKYDARARHKGGDEDYAKAAWYQNYLVEWRKRGVAK